MQRVTKNWVFSKNQENIRNSPFELIPRKKKTTVKQAERLGHRKGRERGGEGVCASMEVVSGGERGRALMVRHLASSVWSEDLRERG